MFCVRLCRIVLCFAVYVLLVWLICVFIIHLFHVLLFCVCVAFFYVHFGRRGSCVPFIVFIATSFLSFPFLLCRSFSLSLILSFVCFFLPKQSHSAYTHIAWLQLACAVLTNLWNDFLAEWICFRL